MTPSSALDKLIDGYQFQAQLVDRFVLCGVKKGDICLLLDVIENLTSKLTGSARDIPLFRAINNLCTKIKRSSHKNKEVFEFTGSIQKTMKEIIAKTP